MDPRLGDRQPSSPPSSVPVVPGATDEKASQWGVASPEERRVPAVIAVVVAAALQVVLPDRLIVGLGPRWLLPALEVALGTVLVIAVPGRIQRESRQLRWLSLLLISLINVANVVSLAELVRDLLYSSTNNGRVLVYASVPVWITNVIVFGLWYWELDRGGPAARLQPGHRRPDFLFPQMTAPAAAPAWHPTFLDYLYTSFTNATAFSPTDTMPISAAAKLLMMVQSLASLLTVALVVSRAVNVLK